MKAINYHVYIVLSIGCETNCVRSKVDVPGIRSKDFRSFSCQHIFAWNWKKSSVDFINLTLHNFIRQVATLWSI